MNVVRIVLTCAFLSCLVTGCKAPDTNPSPGMADPYPAPMNDPNITILSPELRAWLGFQPAIVIEDGQRPMHVEQPVRNLTYEKYLIEYRILFYDENGRELTPVMGWEFVPLDPKQLVRLKRDALSLAACIEELQSQAGRRYDAQVVKACVKLLRDGQAGTSVTTVKDGESPADARIA